MARTRLKWLPASPGLFTSAALPSSESFAGGTVDEIVENNPARSLTELFGANATWTHDALTLSLDLDTSRAHHRDPNGLFTTVRLKDIDYTYDRRTGSPIASFTVSNPNYSPVATDVDHRLAHYMAAEGPPVNLNFDDTINEGRIDAKWDGGEVAVFGGFGYSDRTKATHGFHGAERLCLLWQRRVVAGAVCSRPPTTTSSVAAAAAMPPTGSTIMPTPCLMRCSG